MIRHGRHALDRKGVAALNPGRKAPWNEPSHPPAINLDPLSETPQEKTLPRTFLYDEEQATAWASGKSVPKLPTTDHPEDLLTERDAAAYLNVPLPEFRDRVKSLRIPPPDDKPFGVNHWYRSTIDEYAVPAGRGAGSGEPRRWGVARKRMREVVASLPPGQTVGPTELARKADVSVATARHFLREPELELVATFAQPIGPGLETWDAFMADVRKLAGLKKYAGIAIRITEK
jgi:hypothetical protein